MRVFFNNRIRLSQELLADRNVIHIIKNDTDTDQILKLLIFLNIFFFLPFQFMPDGACRFQSGKDYENIYRFYLIFPEYPFPALFSGPALFHLSNTGIYSSISLISTPLLRSDRLPPTENQKYHSSDILCLL